MLAALKRFMNGHAVPKRIEPFSKDELMKEIERVHEFSPDIAQLRRHYAHLVFLFNGLQSSAKHPHPALGFNATRLAGAFTEDQFSCYIKRAVDQEERFPIAIESNGEGTKGYGELGSFGYPAPILGQLWAVYPNALYGGYPRNIDGLDKLHMNGIYSVRKRVNLIVSCRMRDENNRGQSFVEIEPTLFRVQAWMYVGRADLWDGLISKYNFDAMPLQSKKILAGTNNNPIEQYSLSEKYYYFREKFIQTD